MENSNNSHSQQVKKENSKVMPNPQQIKDSQGDPNQLNSLRKSLPGSTSGLKQLTQVNKESIFLNQQQQYQQKNIALPMNRQSHSLGQNGSHQPNSREQHDKHLSHSQPPGSYQSAQNTRAGINQMGMIGSNNQTKGLSSNAQAGQHFISQNSQVNINTLNTNGQMIGAVQGIKLQNQAILAVTNQGATNFNHKQFSMSTQHGLFPKISNLRGENQIIPSSAHSQVGLLQGTIKTAENTNVFKNSGGHISGMSHQAHQHLMNKEIAMRNASNIVANPVGNQISDFSLGYKPPSSPRQNGHAVKQEGGIISDQNQAYQSNNSQWKTQVNMNYGEFKKQQSNKGNEPSFSPLLQNTAALQSHNEQQRHKQMSSGSEKRLKMHQQRQYYSEQYRVQQLKQHQQTANAVLKQNGEIFAQNACNQGDSTNSNTTQSKQQNLQATMNGQNISGRISQIDQIKQGEYNQIMLSKQDKIPQSLNQNNVNSQLYSQKQKNISQHIMHQNVVLNGQGPVNGSMVISNHNQLNMTIQQHQQISGTINNSITGNNNVNVTSTTSQGNNNQNPIFFKKRCSSNNNTNNIVGSPGPKHDENQAIMATPNEAANQHHGQNGGNSMSPKLGKQNSFGQTHQSLNQNPQFVPHQNMGFQQIHTLAGTTQIRVNSQPSSQIKNSDGREMKPQGLLNEGQRNSINLIPNSQLGMSKTPQDLQQPAQIQQTNNTVPVSSMQHQHITPSVQSEMVHQSLHAVGGISNSTGGQNQGSASQQQQMATQQTQSQQVPPKIPVICGFHKRILLITCQNINNEMQTGMAMNGINPNSSLAQARRIRNKNPNCNHNSNSVFYQPHYNNVKYDDSHKKKEDVLRKVFFKECAKEEEKRLYGGQGQIFQNPGAFSAAHGGIYGASEMARQQAYSQANDPNKHLQIIERILCEYLFVSQPFDRSGKAQLTNTQSLMMELGLDRALTPHRAFLLALIRAGKFTTDNMLKVLSEVKTSATEFDNECIYCKYSQYALKESAKLLHKHQQALIEQSQTNPQQALAAQQQIQANGGIIKGPSGEDIRIENLVRMFQSQLFKKSFINTSLMIIQRKMTEKYFQKYHNAKQAQQAAEQAKQNPVQQQYGPDGKPVGEQKKINKKTKPKNQQNLSSLEYLAKEIQKLSKNLANPKDKERYLDLKEKYYREFLIKVLKSNGVEKIQFPTAPFTPYKYYIGRGNNSGIVRTALKSRFWWSMGEFDDWSDYNFLWTQWKSNKIVNVIKTWKEVNEHEAKDAANPDKKRSSLSTRAGGHIDSQLSTQATDKESNSSKENLITTPKKNKLASSSLGNNSSEPQFRRNGTVTNQSSATKNSKILGRGKKQDDKDDDKEENITSHNLTVYSKQENNFHLANKKAIFYNMRVYFEAIGIEYHSQLPLTFHIKEGLSDSNFLKFEHIFNEANASRSTVLDLYPKLGRQLWIVKPGENTNRGCGITVVKDLDHIKNLVQNTNHNGNKRSYIIQKYIEKPLLYKNRKFDIRIFTLMCTINGNLQGYWYQDGYLRTSCREFTLKNVNNKYIHLTNDAIQKKLEDYGKYESGNKLSFAEFQKYLDNSKVECDLMKDIIPKLKKMTQHSMRAVSRKVDPNRRAFSFEIYGYDFMLDEDYHPWMIEVNTNPCLELSSPFLARLIPAMIENSLKVAVDPIFPPPPVPNSKKHQIPDAIDNRYELIFNERVDAQELKNLPIDDNMNGIIEEEEKEDEGSDEEEEEDQP